MQYFSVVQSASINLGDILRRAVGSDNWYMDLILVLFPLVVVLLLSRRIEERERVRLLAGCLRPFRIESQIEQLTEGYLRILGEHPAMRTDAAWRNLAAIEDVLQWDLHQLADALQDVWVEHMRISRWPMGIPQATRFFPQASFDFRALVKLHAHGFANVLRNPDGLPPRERAFRVTAELLLFQHSCHWFCRSQQVASARLLTRHRTHYQQVLDAVSPTTRKTYDRLVNG